MNATESDDTRMHELERRIEELEAHDEADFGHFTAWDWTACIVFAVVLPLLAFWWWSG